MRLRFITFALYALAAIPLAIPVTLSLLRPAHANPTRQIVFPIIGPANFSNDFYGARSNGIHQATDIFARKMQPVVAVVDGTVEWVVYPQASWGYSISIRDSEGYQYTYIHINNDNPGTDDGNGGPMHAYAPDMKAGNPVVKGQLLGWVGDSGNAENTPPHIHFEIEDFNGSPLNPYYSLVNAPRLSSPVMHPQLPNELLPYGVAFIGLNVAMGNFDADPESEIVTGAGVGGGPHVKIFDDDEIFTGTEFMAYDPRFTGGVDVAAGDVDGDGIDEIITGAGPTGGPHIRVFKLDGSIVGDFFAYDIRFHGGVRVASGDVDNDGDYEIITGAGRSGGPHIRIFEANATKVGDFFAYDTAFTGGVDVASGNVDGTEADEIITGAGPTGGPHVRVFQQDGDKVGDFFAYGVNYHGGIKISVGNIRISSDYAEIVTVPATPPGGPYIRMFDGAGVNIANRSFMEVWWEGYSDIGAGYDTSRAATGSNRRASVRRGIE